MQMLSKCIILFSGGLDSVVAAHLLLQQNIEVIALHFVLPFDQGVASKREEIVSFAQKIGVQLRIEDDAADFIEMLKDPPFGFGKHANPCIACRIRRLKRAKGVMSAEGAQFIATGEVIGQRPMSQRLDSLHRIENHAGLSGDLLRPLSAGLLVPTRAERQGLVDRNRLLSIAGRGRKEQIAYAARFGLSSFPPGGGCLLTFATAAARFEYLKSVCGDFTLSDIQLLAIGRHFRIPSTALFVIARNEMESVRLEALARPDDHLFTMADVEGPFGLTRGLVEHGAVIQCCQILARYSKLRGMVEARISVIFNCVAIVHTIAPASLVDCDSCRIGS
jgi:tRNA-uridine 2-sulfurtransferase